jgi:hypothetical protein
MCRCNLLVKNVLTNQERELMQEYLASGKKLEGFRVIVHRAKKLDLKIVESDAGLIQKFLDKAEGKQP